MADILYTTTDQIRAVMGFTEVNLPDKTLVDHDLATLIEIELDLVYSAHAAAIAAAESTPTTSELSWVTEFVCSALIRELCLRCLGCR